VNDLAYTEQSVLIVLAFSTFAALASALGTLPFSRRESVPVTWMALAYALAAGLMLGAGYILMTEGLLRATMPVILGAWIGVGFTYWTQAFSGTRELTAESARDSGFVVKFILLNALHSASEGIAIGVAMAVNLRFGIFIALALAIHNIAESMVLTDILRSSRTKILHCASIGVVTNVPQVLLAVVAFAIIPAIPGFLSWALGFAAGSLVYLVMTELLPFSYSRAGRTAIAFVVSFATGAVVMLQGFLG
jgi:zinc transporter ZupT